MFQYLKNWGPFVNYLGIAKIGLCNNGNEFTYLRSQISDHEQGRFVFCEKKYCIINIQKKYFFLSWTES